MTYSWLLFDADGTLFDYDQAEATALEQAFAEVGTTFEPAHLNVYREINTRVWSEFEAGRITAERLRLQRFELLFETLGRSLIPAEFSPVYLRHLARASQLIEGAREIVPALCAKYRLALITNGLRDVQRPRLAGSAIRDCFKALIISEEIGAAKRDTSVPPRRRCARRPCPCRSASRSEADMPHRPSLRSVERSAPRVPCRPPCSTAGPP